MSRWIQSFYRFGKDTVSLSRAVWTARSTTTIRSSRSSSSLLKPVLLQQARQSNQVATCLLYMEKEYGLVKYYGWRGYIQQRLPVRSSSSSSSLPSSLSDESSTTTTDNSKTATTMVSLNQETANKKIAFMITTSTKQDLQDKLGYSVEQIKKMTPLQASLVLNHQLPVEQYDEQLPILEAEHEREQEEFHHKDVLEQERQRKEQETAEQLSKTNIPASSSTEEQSSYTFADISSSLSPAQLLASSIGIDRGFEDTWYEVVEIKSNGDAVRQGLYPNEAEAELSLETREMIRNRQQEKDMHRYGADQNEVKSYSTFEVRQISRSEVMEQHQS